tara:strand:+ start:756 stop:1304 length:549 start_codon:yes stop_codon:yes gene_type:complete
MNNSLTSNVRTQNNVGTGSNYGIILTLFIVIVILIAAYFIWNYDINFMKKVNDTEVPDTKVDNNSIPNEDIIDNASASAAALLAEAKAEADRIKAAQQAKAEADRMCGEEGCDNCPDGAPFVCNLESTDECANNSVCIETTGANRCAISSDNQKCPDGWFGPRCDLTLGCSMHNAGAGATGL